MLLTNYDFHDIYRALTMFRLKPLYGHNHEIAKQIKNIIDTPQTDDFVDVNVIRRALSNIASITEIQEWRWVTNENLQADGVKTVHNQAAYRILSESFDELLLCLKEQNEEQIYDLSDALHNVPCILADNNKNFEDKIAVEISVYRKKWNFSFLRNTLGK